MKKAKLISNFTFSFLKSLARFYCFFILKYRYHDKYKIKKDESILVLSNHQTDYDPILIHFSFNKLLRTVATDNIFRNRVFGNFLTKLGAIPKRKGLVDLNCTAEMVRAIKNHQSLLIFAEGNRNYGEFQFYIDPSLPQLIKKLKVTLVLFNIHGGFGISPRFAAKRRKGKFSGNINRVLTYDEYKDMTDDELFKIIKEGIKVYDSDSKEKFVSKRRGEYLERMLFVCPKCGAANKLHSKNEFIYCDNCDFKAEYTEDLHFVSNDHNFKLHRFVDWYEFQRNYVKNFVPKEDKIICLDSNVTLKTANPMDKNFTICKNCTMKLTKNELSFGDIKFKLDELAIASPVSTHKLVFTIENKNYVAIGDKRFNALKYVLFFNKLETKMKKRSLDKYFTLE